MKYQAHSFVNTIVMWIKALWSRPSQCYVNIAGEYSFHAAVSQHFLKMKMLKFP